MSNAPHARSLPSSPGPLLAIGGAEDKLGKRKVLSEFVALAGGPSARIAVIPTASSLGPEVVELYDALFRKLGAAEVFGLRPETREEAADPALIERLEDATGIFMTGGNQLKLSAIVNGSPFGDAILAAHERGVAVAGTSAGASIQSSHMVAFGSAGSTPKQRMTQLAAGLGLIRDVVIDQHFGQRHRYGRLLMLVAQSPGLLGIGIDEDTGALVTEVAGHEILRVLGRGVVTIFDGRDVVSNAHEARRTAPLMASGVVMHVLPAGCVFDLTDKVLITERPDVEESEAAELAVAGRDLKRLAREIAAGDVSSPSSAPTKRRGQEPPEGDAHD